MTPKFISRRELLKLAGVGLGGSMLACSGLTPTPSAPGVPDTALVELTESVFRADNPADNKALVGYATYAGSTLEVAGAIGEELGRRGYRAEVKPITADLQLEGYRAVILGSAVQYGQWLRGARDFVEAHRQALAATRVALFCVHIQNLTEDVASVSARKAYLDAIRPFVAAEEEAFFAGRFDRRGAERLLPKWIAAAMPDMDKRDWGKIRAWGRTVFK